MCIFYFELKKSLFFHNLLLLQFTILKSKVYGGGKQYGHTILYTIHVQTKDTEI